jgi:tetratricopeptide (TPR) repeat protein
MNFTTSKSLATFVLITISLTVYLLTMCPTVYLGDSGELSAAAFCLGVPHASGYPLYVLVGKGFCLLPFGDIGFRMNLMSAVFGVLAVGLVYSLIWRMSGSKVGAWVGGGVLAFIPVFWWQTVAAEVYALHVFFVALMMWLLWRWEETREFYFLVVFSFVTGLSFGNHLQTVMLAPAVYYLILSGDRKVLLGGKRFLLLSVFFVLPFLVYGELPIRTWAGAAMHWGDPDTWDRFWVHVSGRAHRGAYVFNLGVWEYVDRLKESLGFIWDQFGVMVLVGVWGWWRIRVVRWRVFLLGVVVFDLFYTVFLNTISLEITPFNLSVCLVLVIGIGVGIADLMKAIERSVSAGVMSGVKAGWGMVPVVFLVMNFGVSNQSRNYTAYEHALNIFRTADSKAVLLVEGDNNLFPLLYARVTERMREEITLFDRENLTFKIPYLGDKNGIFYGTWEEYRTILENEIIRQRGSRKIFYVVFDHFALNMPEGYTVVPHCLLYQVIPREVLSAGYRVPNLWQYYATESFYEGFERDFMNRQIAGHFYIRYGQYLYKAGNYDGGSLYIDKASRISPDDVGVHFEAAVFFMDLCLFDKARMQIESVSSQDRDQAAVNNLWGIYHYKLGDFPSSVEFFERAVKADKKKDVYYRNLVLALNESGRKDEAERLLKELSKMRKVYHVPKF